MGTSPERPLHGGRDITRVGHLQSGVAPVASDTSRSALNENQCEHIFGSVSRPVWRPAFSSHLIPFARWMTMRLAYPDGR